MKIRDVLWRRQKNNEEVVWERVGILVEKEDGGMFIKLNVIPTNNWDGWLTVPKRKGKPLTEEEPF